MVHTDWTFIHMTDTDDPSIYEIKLGKTISHDISSYFATNINAIIFS